MGGGRGRGQVNLLQAVRGIDAPGFPLASYTVMSRLYH